MNSSGEFWVNDGGATVALLGYKLEDGVQERAFTGLEAERLGI